MSARVAVVDDAGGVGGRLVRPARAAHSWLRRRVATSREVTFPLSTLSISGNLQYTTGGVFAWFVLGGQPWDFRTLDDRRRLWDQQTFRYGQLAASRPEGRPIRLRVSTRPYPSYEYARSLDEQNPNPLPQVAGGESWDDYLGYAQRRLQSTGLDQKVVALGVWVGVTPRPAVRDELCAGAGVSPQAKVIGEQIALVSKTVAGPGFDGRPATARDMAFLFHRSLSMGVPAPVHAGVGGARWEVEDLAEFASRRVWLAEPYGSSVTIRSEVRGGAVCRHAAVLTMGVMPDRTWPEDGRDPWMVASNRLGFPVEWSLSGSLLSAKTLAKAIQFEQNRAGGIAAHYDEHRLVPPPSVGRAIRGAAENLDEVTEGDSRTAARFLGTVRVAVYGTSEDEALARARAVVDLYGEQLGMGLHHARGQAGALREFVPGEPRELHGFQRRMPVRYLASAMPNVDSDLGTPTGAYLGYGVGSARRASRFDPHFGPEVLNTPGLFPIVAEPGGGKSVLIGTLAYNAVRAGQPTIIFDPSGPLARLAALPELAPFSRVLDLTASKAGTLSPYALIPEPTRDGFVDELGGFNEVEFARAVRRASAERQQLMFDVLRMWLPASTLRLPGTDVMLRDALRRVAARSKKRGTADNRTNPRWVVEELEGIGSESDAPRTRELAKQLVEELSAAAEFPLGELIMPPHRHAVEDEKIDDATLVVVTMPGLAPPPEAVEREFWGSEERYTQPLLHLAAFFASKFIYGRPRDVRKNVFLDENHLMGQWGSGRAFFVRLSRDSRKWNTAIGAASQHPADHLSIGRVDALMGSAFVGRLTKAATAVEACQLVQCPEAYAPVIQALSPKPREGQTAGETGEFVWLDPLGRLGKIRVDLDWHPALRAALQTTPGRPRAAAPSGVQPTPFIDPDLFDLVPVVPLADEVAV